MDIRVFRTEDEAAVVALWEGCGLIRPWNDPRKDVARKLAVQPEFSWSDSSITRSSLQLWPDTKDIVAGSTTWR